jgi:SNF2 family DNA or RNA helicase
MEEFNDPILTKCGHMFCRPCMAGLKRIAQDEPIECPICRVQIDEDAMLQVPSNRTTIDPFQDWRHSTKTQKLMEELGRLRAEDPSIKSVVFSQWTAMLDLVEIPLQQAGITFYRLDGSLSLKQRVVVLDKFKKEEGSAVFLVSVQAGGVGLNLTCASRVFFLDCWWNPSVEDQAIQRVHRIGQKHDVIVYRFIIKDTVEERILQLQDRKRKLAFNITMSDSGEGAKVGERELAELFDLHHEPSGSDSE